MIKILKDFIKIYLTLFIIFGIIPEIFIWMFGSKRYKFFRKFNYECERWEISVPRATLLNYMIKNKFNYYDYEDAFYRVYLEFMFDENGNLDLSQIPLEYHEYMYAIYSWSDERKRKYDYMGNRIR